MVNPQDRSHEFYILQDANGKWRWTWLLPMREAAVNVSCLYGYKTKGGALRSAKVQTDRLRRMMVDLSRGDMVENASERCGSNRATIVE